MYLAYTYTLFVRDVNLFVFSVKYQLSVVST